MKLNDKVKVIKRGSTFFRCIGYIRAMGLNETGWQVEIHKMGEPSDVMRSIMDKPVAKRLYWFNANELEVME